MQFSSFLNKTFMALGATLLLTSSAHGTFKNSTGSNFNKEDGDTKPDTFAYSYSKDMNLVNPIDFHFYGDFILLQPQEDGLDYAILDAVNAGTLPINNGSVQGFSTGQQDWSWDVGFRLGVGGFLPHGDWNLDLSWLRFKSNQEVSESVKSRAGFIPLWTTTKAGVPDSTHESSSARWHFKINLVDGSLSKPYYVSRYFVLNPFWGLRASHISQCYYTRYSGQFGVNENNTSGPQKTQATNNFWGIGPRVGISSEWLLGVSNLQFLNSLSFSSLMGNFDVSQCAPGNANYTYHQSFKSISVNMDLQLGFGWGIHFNEDQNFFSVTAMYEFQQWWDQNWMRITQGGSPTFLSDIVSRGDLRLNGFLFRFQFDF